MKTDLNQLGKLIDSIVNLSSNEAAELLKNDVTLIDIRKQYETDYKKFDVKNFILIPKNTLHDNLESLNRNAPYIIADSTGLSSKKAVVFLQSNGFTNVANLSGGIMDWERNGLPVSTDKNEALAKPYFYDNKPKNFVKTTLVKKDVK